MRYAPSPTGRLHIGNLRTAWIAHQFAIRLGLDFVVRFEDIDSPRVVTGAREQQRLDLISLGLNPNLELLQSDFRGRHFSLFQLASKSGRLYPCECSRREVLAQLASAPHSAESMHYSGHCRNLSPERSFRARETLAWRFRMPDPSGRDDFIVARTDPRDELESSFVPAYHWACAIDDIDGGYQLLVRATDLRSAQTQQQAIQEWLIEAGEAPPNTQLPAIFHTSLVVQNQHRLEKRTAGITLPELLARQLNTERLTFYFSRSFAGCDSYLLRSDPAVPPGGALSEPQETLELSELLLG